MVSSWFFSYTWMSWNVCKSRGWSIRFCGSRLWLAFSWGSCLQLMKPWCSSRGMLLDLLPLDMLSPPTAGSSPYLYVDVHSSVRGREMRAVRQTAVSGACALADSDVSLLGVWDSHWGISTSGTVVCRVSCLKRFSFQSEHCGNTVKCTQRLFSSLFLSHWYVLCGVL